MDGHSTVSHSQWVDLGIHTDVCMTRPETCGAAGGAISLWMKPTDPSGTNGIISSYANPATGSLVLRSNDHVEYDSAFTFNMNTSKCCVRDSRSLVKRRLTLLRNNATISLIHSFTMNTSL